MDARSLQIRMLTAGMALLERHPRFVRWFLRPFANAPLLGRRMKVLPRAFLGATAFEIHDVDLATGRIGIGGVEEIMAGSKIVELLHTVLADRMGEEEKNRTLYELGRKLCRWEVTQSLEHGKWAPAQLVPLIMNAEILDEIQRNPWMARFFQKVMNRISRLITDEGGWGHLEFDLSSFPLKVTLTHSQEAAWLGRSETPVCHFYAGIVAGYAGAISGEDLLAREVSCRAMGAPHCEFELVRAGQEKN
jgi:bacteriochlorophyll 4-vinyl reductase